MTIGCNIWMICLIFIWFFYGLSRMFHLPQFVWALRSSVWDVFVNFLLIDATDRSKISGDQKRFFIALSLYPLSFFANTPFKYFLVGIYGLYRMNKFVYVNDSMYTAELHVFHMVLGYLKSWFESKSRLYILQFSGSHCRKYTKANLLSSISLDTMYVTISSTCR